MRFLGAASTSWTVVLVGVGVVIVVIVLLLVLLGFFVIGLRDSLLVFTLVLSMTAMLFVMVVVPFLILLCIFSIKYGGSALSSANLGRIPGLLSC